MTNDRKALWLGLSAIALWSTVATAMKLALRELDVLQLLTIAVCCSALALLTIVAWQKKLPRLSEYFRETPGYFLLMGLVNPLGYYLILFRSYDLLPAQQAQPINYTWAIMLALLAVPLLGQRLTARDILAVVLGYLGVVVIATRGDLLGMEFDSVEGVIYALVSTVVWALYWIASTRNTRDPIVSLCVNFLVAAPLAVILCAIFSDLSVANWRGLLPAVYVGLFEMGITFVLWSLALRYASGVSRVGNLIFLSPLLSLVFIATILGESIHPATLIGLALIIPGVLLQQQQRPVERVSE
ncbi:MAG: DMT family transporter [Halioglobus sp.]